MVQEIHHCESITEVFVDQIGQNSNLLFKPKIYFSPSCEHFTLVTTNLLPYFLELSALYCYIQYSMRCATLQILTGILAHFILNSNSN